MKQIKKDRPFYSGNTPSKLRDELSSMSREIGSMEGKTMFLVDHAMLLRNMFSNERFSKVSDELDNSLNSMEIALNELEAIWKEIDQ